MRLTKHHGLGNDFLIAVNGAPSSGPETLDGDTLGGTPLEGDTLDGTAIGGTPLGGTALEHEVERRRLAPVLCHRRTGIGADGLIVCHARSGSAMAEWDMILWNSDGSRAELSGNGLRCVGQALAIYQDHHGRSGEDRSDHDQSGHVRSGDEWTDDRHAYTVHTAAGPRTVVLSGWPTEGPTVKVEVGMGTVTAGPEPWSGWADLGVDPVGQIGVDVGNPHLVVFVHDLDAIDLAKLGPIVEASYPDGVNVEFVAAPGTGAPVSSVEMRVWERGAGVTQACGSGAVATAWAARQLGIGGDGLAVVMPGGEATVAFDGDDATLTGPATFVAELTVDIENYPPLAPMIEAAHE